MATVNQEAAFRAWVERKNKEQRVRKESIHLQTPSFNVGSCGSREKRNGERKKSLPRENG